jgi:glycerol kinase
LYHIFMPRFVAAIDQGTTSTRCILFDRTGIVAAAQREHEQILPQPGWVEHDPIEIWRRTEEVIAASMQQAGARRGEVAAIGIANQRETTVVWDRSSGTPFCNAIVWQDTRTKPICDELEKRGLSPLFQARTGLPLATYFSGPKIRWIIDHVPGVKQAVERGDARFGNIDSWLIWNLTGGSRGGAHVTDVTNASRTMMMDLRTLRWDPKLLEALDMPSSILPTIVASSDPGGWGTTARDGAFGDCIPVCGDLGDQQAALVGQACFEPGESKNTYGTGCFMLLNTGTTPVFSKHGLLTTVAYKLGGAPAHYALEGSVAVAGALVQWLRDQLGIIRSSGEIEELAAGVNDNGGIYVVPAFSGLFAPYWKSDARGVIVGLTRQSNRGHLARSCLEATAFQTRDVVEAMVADSGVDLAELRVDGGMSVNDLLMQFQADVLGTTVVRPKISETTALGAAYAAGLAVGFWKDTGELRKSWQPEKTWKPVMEDSRRVQLCRDWARAVERSFGWIQ